MKKTQKRVQEKVRLLDENTPFAITEAFNQLRTNIMYTPNDSEGCPVYGITSAEMSVGKSTISANLAYSFAQLGKKVLIVDADMRRPTQHKFFCDRKSSEGLSELLSDIRNDYTSLVCKPFDEMSLDVLCSGAIPPNPSALMLSKKIGELIGEWKKDYDIVFIDLPPVGMVTDPLTISSYINGYIMVVTMNKSDARAVNGALEAIEQVGAKVIGVVANGISSKGNGGKGTKYAYNYTYGYYYKQDTDDN